MRKLTLQVLRNAGILLLIAALLPAVAPVTRAAQGLDQTALLHDSRSDLYRVPLGAVPVQTTVTLRFRTAADGADSVTALVTDDFQQTQTPLPMAVLATTPDGYDLWEAVLDVGKTPTVYHYSFLISGGGDVLYYEDDTRPGDAGAFFPANEGGPGAAYMQSPGLPYQITVYDPGFYTPEWMRNAVVYQIFPDRFRNGDPGNDPTDPTITFYDNQHPIVHQTWNESPVDPRQPGAYQNQWNLDFFGGDLAGITEELDYLQSLGVTAIYLNPIFEARSNHRYDTADYKTIDPYLGTLEDFQTLVSEAQQRGIVLILDGVFNHLSSDSPFFDRYGRYPDDGACESLQSPYRNWFFFVPPKGPQPAACVDNPQGATYYTGWAGYDSIPKIDNNSPGPRLYIFLGRRSVVATWGAEGIGGWRLDVGGDIDPGGPASDYWENFRVAVHNANPESVIIGEEWGNASRWLLGSEWDAVMNYRLRNGILGFVRDENFYDNDSNGDRVIYALSPAQVDDVIRAIESDTPPMAYQAMMNILDSHDTSRLMFVAGDAQRQQLAALLQFALPGAPTIYYGDEIGINAPSVDDNGTLQDDPYNRAPYPWPDTSGDTYGPPDEAMLAFYRTLAGVRHDTPALRDGQMITLRADAAQGLYAFLRVDAASGSAALVVLNDSTSAQTAAIDLAGLVPSGLVLTPAFGADSSTSKGEPISLLGAVTAELPGASGPPAGGLSTDQGRVEVTVGPLSGNIWTVNAGEAFTLPAAPDNLAAESGSGSVVLTWDAVPGAAGYQLYRSPVAVGGFEPVGDVVTDPTATDATVTNGYRYTYAVATIGADGLRGELGAGVQAIPTAPVSEAHYLNRDLPQSITYGYGVTVTVQMAITIAGQTGADGPAAGVQAEAAFYAADSLEPVGTMKMSYAGEGSDDSSGADVYAATLAVPTTPGDWTIRAQFSTTAGETWTLVTNPDGTWPALTVSAPTDTEPPAPPASASVELVSLSGVTLAWKASPSADVAAYHITRTSDGDTRSIALVPAGDDLRYVDKAVAAGTRYTYAIAAVDGALNESEPVTTAEVKVERQKVPVTFNVTVPDYTKDGPGDVYLAGDLGTDDLPFWDPAGVVMTQIDDQHWTVTLEIPEGASLQYKYARGTWNAVEKGVECEEIANRTLKVEQGVPSITVDDIIAKWRDLDKCP